jgi:N-acyl-D-amino-acid deacylase
MTGLSATTFGLAGRGFVREGLFADLCVFDAETVIDRADFASPCLPSTGIDTVIVNGVPVWRDGAPTGERPGRVLRRQAPRTGAGASAGAVGGPGAGPAAGPGDGPGAGPGAGPASGLAH